MFNRHNKNMILFLANQRAQFRNEKCVKFQNRTWSVFYGPWSYIQSSNAGPKDEWKGVKFNAIHDKVIHMCNISWYNYSCWFSLLPRITNSVLLNRLSSPNIHQSLYIVSDKTIYMILGHSDCNMFTKNNNKKSTFWLLKLLHLKIEN
jgi:hypothetical protein